MLKKFNISLKFYLFELRNDGWLNLNVAYFQYVVQVTYIFYPKKNYCKRKSIVFLECWKIPTKVCNKGISV